MKASNVDTQLELEQIKLKLFETYGYHDGDYRLEAKKFLDTLCEHINVEQALLLSCHQDIYELTVYRDTIQPDYLTDISFYHQQITSKSKSPTLRPLRKNNKAYIKLIAELRIDESPKVFTVESGNQILILIDQEGGIRSDIAISLIPLFDRFSNYLSLRIESDRDKTDEETSTKKGILGTSFDSDQESHFLKHVLKVTNNAYIGFSLDHKILFFSNKTRLRHKRILGITLKKGNTIEETYGKEKFENTYKKIISDIKQGKKIPVMRFEAQDKKGLLRLDIEYGPIYDKENNLIGILEFAHDVSEIVENKNLLSQRTATLNAVLESIDESIYAVNPDMEIIFANKKAIKDFKKGLGINIKEGVNMHDLVDQKTIKRWKESYFDKVFDGEIVKYLGDDGATKRIVENVYRPVKNKQEEILGCLEISRDLTEINMYKDMIKESEFMFRTIIDSLPTCIARIGFTGEISFVSPRTTELLSSKKSFIIGKSLFDFVVKEDHSKLSRDIVKLLSGGGDVFNSFRVRDQLGRIIHVEGIASLIRDTEDNPKEYLLAFNDVTDRVLTRQELISTQNKYELLFKNLTEAIVLYDYNKEHVVECNDSALKMLKYTEAEITKRSRWDFVPEKSNYFPGVNLHENIKAHKSLVEKGELIKARGVFVDAQNEEILVDVNIIPSFVQKEQAYLLIRDVTKRQLAKKELSEKKAIYESMVSNAFDGIDVLEYDTNNDELLDGRLVVRNEPMRRILHNQDNLFDTVDQYLDISPELQPDGTESKQKLKDLFVDLLKHKSSLGEFTLLKPDGSDLHLDTSQIIVRIKEKAYVVRNYRDITQRKNASDIIRRQIEDLNQKNKELEKYISSNLQLENFAYIASHDLKAPIRSVISFMQLLRKNIHTQIDEKNLRFVDIVLEASTNMQVLIDDLLAYSRINTKEVEIEKLDMHKMFKGLITELSSSIKEKNGVVNLHNIPDYINADFMRIRQVFQNLITNGMKFTAPDVNPAIDIYYEKDKSGYHKFKVVDNGIGIEEEYLDKIFLMFKKLHSENKYQGTGIGLSICKKVIDQHQGQIWVESEIGNGSQFYFTIKDDIQLTI